MCIVRLVCLALTPLLLFDVHSAAAENLVALIIGNGNYATARLNNPQNDARLIASTLRSLNHDFQIMADGAQSDLPKVQMEALVEGFGKTLHAGDVGLFYFSGHGIQLGNSNYLVPIGADPKNEADAKEQLVSADWIIEQMQKTSNRLNIIVLDACRTNPFSDRAISPSKNGLAPMNGKANLFIAFAASPGLPAIDDSPDGIGSNGPYALALSNALKQPGVGLFDLFNDADVAVYKSTQKKQNPTFTTYPITENFYFVPPKANEPEVVWTPFANGTTFANRQTLPVQIYLKPDLNSDHGGTIDIGEKFPSSGDNQVLLHGSYQGDEWIRIKIGGSSLAGYVLENSVTVLDSNSSPMTMSR